MLDVFYQNPMAWIGFIFACIGMVGLALFLLGFFAGLPHLLTIAGDDEYLEKRRFRATWGLLIMAHAFLLWEIIRYVATWFGGQPVNSGFVGGLVLTYILLFVILQIAFGVTNIVTGGH